MLMNHSDTLTQKQKTNSFLKLSGLLVGFNPRSSDSDSVRSPTSPLDFIIFSSLRNPFKHPRTPDEARKQKSWNSSKVGLSIVDSLDDEAKEPGKIIQSFDKKNNNSPEAPKNEPGFNPNHVENCGYDVLFEIGKPLFEPSSENENARPMDSGNYGPCCKSGFGPSSISIVPVPMSEIVHSEDYTCVRIHGPNPKVTHIFGDRVLECHDDELTVFIEKIENDEKTLEAGRASDVMVSYPSNGFLKFCHSCKKELDGEDIYMYRGEIAFCSCDCRSKAIEFEEEMEKPDNNNFDGDFDSSSSGSEAISKSGLFIAT